LDAQRVLPALDVMARHSPVMPRIKLVTSAKCAAQNDAGAPKQCANTDQYDMRVTMALSNGP
jgi:hypothetical protein